MEICDILASLL